MMFPCKPDVLMARHAGSFSAQSDQSKSSIHNFYSLAMLNIQSLGPRKQLSI
jgi:hypothetical protein